MSRILRRPMFRKGGQVMDGVMNLATGGRAKYKQAGRVTMQDLIKDDPFLEDIYQTAKADYDRDVQQERSDVLANLLIRGGLAAVSGKGATGNVLRDLASAFQAPTDVALKEMAALKQDPAAMLTAQTAIKTKVAERLKLLELQNQKLDAQKKAKVVAGPKREGESDVDYNKRVNNIASQIIMQPITSAEQVQKRFEESKKNKEIENIQSIDRIQSRQGAEIIYEFRKNPEIVKENTGQEIGQDGGLIFGVTQKGKVNYSAAARNKRDGIYYDPNQNTWIKIQNNIPEIINNPLKGKIKVSGLPGPKTEDIITKQEGPAVLEQQKKNPFLYMG